MKRLVFLALLLYPTESEGSCLPNKLQQWVDKVSKECPGTVLGRTRVPGSKIGPNGPLSAHHSCEAIDIVGKPSCMYRVLHDFPGQMSIDYGRVCHIHLDTWRWGKKIRFKHRYPAGC